MDNRISLGFPGGKRIDAKIGKFTVKTDQSKKYGGEESQPEPFQLFLVSIATCAGIYALSFCDSRKISTEGLALEMTWDYDREVKRITRITLELTLPKGFPEKYESAILRAVDKCTVKKHILTPPEFEIKTV